MVTTSPEIFKKIVDSIIPVIRKKGNRPCVIVPPLPHNLFVRCCNDESHCTNAKEENYAIDLLSGFTKLRHDLIRQLVHSGISDFKVLDSCCVTTCSPNSNLPERLESLRVVTREDGVHYSAEGYRNLATRAIKCITDMAVAPVKAVKKTSHFWRGFRSPNGSSQPKNNLETGRNRLDATARGALRGRTGSRMRGCHIFHPYKRW